MWGRGDEEGGGGQGDASPESLSAGGFERVRGVEKKGGLFGVWKSRGEGG